MIDGIPEEEITSWWQFLERVEALEQTSPPPRFFRGQARAAKWTLRPRLTRIVEGLDEKAALEIERHVQLDFQSQAHLYAPARMVFPPHDVLSQWGLMQHYGAPTRLLDWTLSPYVAAYFAVHQHADTKGEIWILSGDLVQTATREKHKEHGVLPEDPARQKARLMNLEGEPILYFTGLRVHTDRMGAQQMGFTMANRVVCDHADLIMQLGAPTEALTKLVIPAALKPRFMRRLLRMNITGRALFPGIDGLGRSAVELAELEAAYHLGLA